MRDRFLLLCLSAVLSLTAAISRAAEPDAAPVLDEIVVTAQKREENLQSTPLTVTAITKDAIERNSVTTVSDIQELTPGLTFHTNFSENITPLVSLRGETQTRVDLGKQPAVPIYIDGVYTSTSAGANVSSMLDTARVEVLKGPQGILYGRNSTGGSINIITEEPKPTEEGLVTAGGGNFGAYNGGAVLNIPVSAILDLRIVGEFSKHGGYGEDLTTGTSLLNSKDDSLRAALKVTISDTLHATLRADFSHSEGGGNILRLTTLVPGGAMNAEAAAELGLPFTATGLAAARQAILNQQPTDPYDVRLSAQPANFNKYQAWGTSLTVIDNLMEGIDIKSISAWREMRREWTEDSDGTTLLVLSSDGDFSKLNQFTQELQANIQAFDNRLNSVVGGYYFDSRATEYNNVFFVKDINPAFGNTALSDIDDHSTAIYSQASFAITPKFDVTLGARYTDESGLMTADKVDNLGDCLVPPIDLTSSRCFARYSVRDDVFTYKAGLDFKPTSGVLTYFNVSKGFKAPAFNFDGSVVPGSFSPSKPEFVTQYEFGAKSEIWDRRIRLNGAVYFSKMTDVQRLVTLSAPGGGVYSLTENAADATVKGFEGELTAVVSAYFQIQATLAYTDAHYDRYSDASGNHVDNQFPATPLWQYGIGGNYTVPTDLGPINASLQWYWQSEQDFDPDDHSAASAGTAIQSGYGLLSGRVSWKLDRPNVEIAVFARNLTDKVYIAGGLDVTGALGYGVNYLGIPRTFGAQVTKRW